MYASGAIAVGDVVSASTPINYIKKAPVTSSGAAIIGYALETATDGELVQIFVNVGAGSAAVS